MDYLIEWFLGNFAWTILVFYAVKLWNHFKHVPTAVSPTLCASFTAGAVAVTSFLLSPGELAEKWTQGEYMLGLGSITLIPVWLLPLISGWLIEKYIPRNRTGLPEKAHARTRWWDNFTETLAKIAVLSLGLFLIISFVLSLFYLLIRVFGK